MAEKGPGGHEVGRVSVRVVPNTTGFRRRLQTELEAETRGVDAEVSIRPDLKGFREKIKAAASGIEAAVNIDADTRGLRQKINASTKGLRANVEVDVDRSALGRISDAISSIKAPSFGSGINPSGYAAMLAGITVVAAPLIGLVTTALLSLPGLVSLVAAPIAAVTLGLDGFKKAAEAIKPQFEALQKTMSDAAQTAFTPVLQNLADTVFPALQRALPGVTQGLATLAQGVVNAFNQPGNMQKFEDSITRIGDALANMSPGFQSMTSGLLGLVDQFSLKLPAVSQWFNDTMADFDRWVAKVSADGSLQTAFEGLGTTIKTILDSMGQLALSGMEWMKKPENMDDFISGLKSILESLESIAETSAKIEGAFKNMLPNFSWEGIKEDLTTPFTSPDAPWRKFEWDSVDSSGIKNAAAEASTAVEGIGLSADQSKEKLNQLLQGGAGMAASGASPITAMQEALVAPPTVKPPDTAPAEAKLAEYQGFVDTITAQVRGSLQQATSGESLPAPNFDAFKAAWSALPAHVSSQVAAIQQAASSGMQGIVNVFIVAGSQIVGEVQKWPGAIAQALTGLQAAGQQAGAQLAAGMVAGIQGGIPSVTAAARNLASQAEAAAKAQLGIKSPSRVFMGIGEFTAEGFGKGIESGFQDVTATARAMALGVFQAFQDVFGNSGSGPTLGFNLGNVQQQMQQVSTMATDLRGSVNSAMAAAVPTQHLGEDTKEMRAQLDLQQQQLELEKKRLAVDKASTEDKAQRAAIQAEIDKLDLQKKQLAYQEQQLKVAGQYGDQVGQTAVDYQGIVQQMADIPQGFAQANANQFMSDLGIGGSGALPALAQYGMDFAAGAAKSVFNFNVSSADEAIAIKNNQLNKDSLQYRR